MGGGVVEWHTGWMEGDCEQVQVGNIEKWRRVEYCERRGWCRGVKEWIPGGQGSSEQLQQLSRYGC